MKTTNNLVDLLAQLQELYRDCKLKGYVSTSNSNLMWKLSGEINQITLKTPVVAADVITLIQLGKAYVLIERIKNQTL